MCLVISIPINTVKYLCQQILTSSIFNTYIFIVTVPSHSTIKTCKTNTFKFPEFRSSQLTYLKKKLAYCYTQRHAESIDYLSIYICEYNFILHYCIRTSNSLTRIPVQHDRNYYIFTCTELVHTSQDRLTTYSNTLNRTVLFWFRFYLLCLKQNKNWLRLQFN